MKETVRQPKNAWLVAVAIGGIAVAYFYLLGKSDFPEPGLNIEYNIEAFEDLDKIETNYVEKEPIALDLVEPRAMAVVAGKLYVAGNNTVAIYGENGERTAEYAFEGVPTSIGADPDGTIFVGLKNKICVLDANGVKQTEWTEFTPRSYITAIATSGPDVFVADAGKRVVMRLDRNGKVQTEIGKKDLDRDVPGLEAPSPYLDLALNADGDLWVVNPGKLGLEQYRSDGSIVTSWYRPTVLELDGFPGCCNPTHIAFTSKGDLITSEKGLVRLKKFEVTSGEFNGLVVGSALFPKEQSVRDIAVDSRDRILVLDAKQKSVRIFALKETVDGSTTQPA